MSKRFNIIASSPVLVIVPGKTAIKVELHYGKDGEPTEIVIAEMYTKDGEWAYTRSQVRVNATLENTKFLLENVKSMFESSKDVKKEPKTTKVEKAISSMTQDEKAALMELLLKDEKPKAAKKTKKEDELELEDIITSIKIKKGGK